MLMLSKLIAQKISAMIGLAAAPDFPKTLIWDKMYNIQKRKLINNKFINFTNSDGSESIFSYKLIKDSFKNLTLSENINFKGPVYLYHGMKDLDVPYYISIEIMKKIKGSKNIKLLLDKDAGHRLSEKRQLSTIIDIISKVSLDI